MIHFISDTHFSHTNIIKYCNRPFNNIDEMNNVIIENWNKIVKEDDIVYHLGDFAFKTCDIEKIINSLNGKIYLIKGNHDQKSTKFYNDIGLEVIPTQTKLDEYKLILSHRPLMDSQIPKGYINIHGHIHNNLIQNELDESIYSIGRHINVSVDVIDFKPISINKLKK